MRNIIFILFLLGIASCGDGVETEVVEDDSVTSEKDTIIEVKENENRLAVLEEEIIANPESSNGYYKRAVYYKKHYDFSNAVDDINRALKLAPDAASMNYEKAEILYLASQYKGGGDISLLDESEIYLNYTLEYDSINTDALLLLAKIKAAGGETGKAMEYVNRVLKENQFLPGPYYVKGMIYKSLGNREVAESSFQTAIEMDANFYSAMIELGWLYAEQKNELALTYYNSALEINPTSIEATRNKGLYYHFSEDYVNARIWFHNMLKIDSLNEEAYFNIGNTYVGVYRDEMPQYTRDTVIDRAVENFQKALDINPRYVQSWYNMGVCYDVKGDKAKAKEIYTYILELENNYQPAIDGLNGL